MLQNKISLAPLQGFTDFTYRNAIHEIIGGVDKFYTPYLRFQNDESLKKKNINDVLPENNIPLIIPQILVNNSGDFIKLANYLSELGYSELNWNLGCPYPMVTNRELGSGLLPNPKLILKILDGALPKINIKVSIKMRTGLNSHNEINEILPHLNNYDLTEIIIHPRYGKQLYKSSANINVFKECLKLSSHKIAYNGDITNLNDFMALQNELKTVDHFMIGRGLLRDVFLAQRIKKGTNENQASALAKLFEFHKAIYTANKLATSGSSHLLNKMQQFWSYFYLNIPDGKKVFKKIKKCTSEATYLHLIESTFHQTNK